MVKIYGFEQNADKPCIYKCINDIKATFLVLYVDDILLIQNDVGELSSNKMIVLSQASYIDKVLERFPMNDAKLST
ncbi:gag/pol protein [Gossypium australe]|uniref:Gag/pol protein n=1 Tax=Gossypium australe TaxID=47621 RepID=A0A5B6WNI0_9ROSI|nr:gag/pol protein [Gossypium australe]